MDKAKKKRIRKIIALACVAAVVVLLAVMPLLAAGQEASDGPQASILSGSAEYTTIESVLLGGGALTEEDAVTISVPSAVKLTEYLVSNGDTVTQGTPIASVDRISVMTAITQVQDALETLADEIEAVSDEEAATEVTAQAGGTVKCLYAQEGDSVQDVMLTYGALAVLSLDGKMSVQLQTEAALVSGDGVTVILADGTAVTGKVESNLAGATVVTLSDEGYAVGETVQVSTEDGTVLGSGALQIHSPWNAIAYAGTVSDLEVSEGEDVSAGETLMELSDTGHTSQFQQLSDQHREYEQMMMELFQMYQTEQITAPCDGVVSGVDENSVQLLASTDQTFTITFLSNAPNGDDETQYANYIGQVSAVGIDGLVLKVNPQVLSITDYKDLTGVPTDPATMTQDVIYASNAPVYELTGGEWSQIEYSAIGAGDILLFAADSTNTFVWVVRVSQAAGSPSVPEPDVPTDPVTPTEPGDPTAPTQPDQSSDPSEPTDPNDSAGSTDPSDPSTEQPSTEQPSAGTQGGVASAQGGGSYSGSFSASGATGAEEETSLYSLDVTQIAAVTPQDTMTIEITIDELDISALSVGQTANIHVEALSGESHTGTITGIGNVGTNNGGNSKFTVTVTLPRGEKMLGGMTAAVSIPLSAAEDALSVPVAALVDTGTQTLLYTGYDEETGELLNPIAVTIGLSDGENAQILSGLNAGDTYYYAYYDTLEISTAPDTVGFSGFGSMRFSFGR